MSASRVDVFVGDAVRNALAMGAQPSRVLVGVAAYRALVARDRLAPRSIGKVNDTTVRTLVEGFNLPVDCDKTIADGEAVCRYVAMDMGIA